MLAVVEGDAEQEAKRGEAKDEKALRTPPTPQQVVAARPHRQPTPDHPPYCWMISEAIDALAEDGGSSEDSISAFICARHPGVPPAHDKFFRHYLNKHVAEGVFVRTAAGLYQRCPEESTDEELLLEQAEASKCKPAPIVAKRGRGRPRKNGSLSTPPAGRNNDDAGPQWIAPPAGSSLKPKDSVPVSPVAVAEKDKSQSSLKPKRRRWLRRLGMATTTDSSGEALVAGKKDGSEVPYTLDKKHEPQRELGLVILGDSSAASTMEVIFGDSSAASTMDKACTEVSPTTPPVGSDQPLNLALVTTTEVPVPEPVPTPTPAIDKGGDQPLDLALVTTTEVLVPEPAPTPTPAMDKGGSQPLNLALVTTTEVPVPEPVPTPTPAMDKGGDQPLDLSLVITTEVLVPEPAPTPTPAMDKGGSQPLNLALVTTTEVPAFESAPPISAMNKDGQPLDLALVTTTEVSMSELAPTPISAMDKDGQPLDLTLVTTTEVPMSELAPTPTPAMDKDGGNASSIVDKIESICTPPTVPEPGSQACKMALMAAAAAGFVPVLVAGKKDVLQPCKASSAPTAGKKAGGKALSAIPKGHRRQNKSAAVATGDRSALTPGKKLACKVSFASPKMAPVIAGGSTPVSAADQGGMETSAALCQSHKLMLPKRPHKLYPATADEISDDPGIVLLALPSQKLAASNT